MNFGNLCMQLSFEPFIFARLFGNIKSHKPNCTIRPIVSAPDCIGKHFSNWVLKKLGTIAELFQEVKIKSAYDLFSRIADIRLAQNHRLVTWDYNSSMFTNIPFEVAKSIIRKYYYPNKNL